VKDPGGVPHDNLEVVSKGMEASAAVGWWGGQGGNQFAPGPKAASLEPFPAIPGAFCPPSGEHGTGRSNVPVGVSQARSFDRTDANVIMLAAENQHFHKLFFCGVITLIDLEIS